MNEKDQTISTEGEANGDQGQDKGQITDAQKDIDALEAKESEQADKLFDSGTKEKDSGEAEDDLELGSKDKDKKSDESDEKEADNKEQIKIELKASALSENELAVIEGFAKESGLTNESANKLAKMVSDSMAERFQAEERAYHETVEQWKTETKRDPVIGGQNYESNVSAAREAVEKFGSDGFVKLLNDFGYGNHPEVVKTFMKIGLATRNDRIVSGKPANVEKPMEAYFYKNNYKGE